MNEFVAVLQEARTWREIALITQSPLNRSELARGHVYQQWAADNRHRTQRQFIKALRNRSPFADVLARRPATEEVECEYAGEPAEGIGAAHLMGGLCVSLPVATAWHRSWLEADFRVLAENDRGEPEIRETTESVRHASRTIDLKPHEAWGRASGLGAVLSAAQLWDGRADFFPSLRFLPRVKQDLDALQLPALIQVRTLLERLERSAAGWDPSQEPIPAWQGAKITPEHAQRSRLCHFTDTRGEDHCYGLARTLHPGRRRLTRPSPRSGRGPPPAGAGRRVGGRGARTAG
ncbi:hypothetical protein [Streptomyces triticirhizae]|nr:hypothetical protein [Streptomyces triticirhizae]